LNITLYATVFLKYNKLNYNTAGKELEESRKGDRMTLEDIAKLANVSKATVSRVINKKSEGVGKETRERVERIVQAYNYSPFPFSRPKTFALGVIVPDIRNDFFIELTCEIERAATQRGYSVILCHSESDIKKEEKALATLMLMHVDGIILNSAAAEAVDVHHSFYSIPHVLIDRTLHNIGNSVCITVDNEFAVFKVTEHLIKNGRERILFISGSAPLSTSVERLNGHVTALKHCGLPFRQELIKYGDYTYQSGVDIITQAHEEKLRFDAVIAANDNMAIGAMNELKKLGYAIPRDIEMFGFDNTRNSQIVDPALSTVAQPVREMGEKSVELLLAQINNEPITERWVHMDSRLVFRESTKTVKREDTP
jgi:LacI family transcriptional regulator